MTRKAYFDAGNMEGAFAKSQSVLVHAPVELLRVEVGDCIEKSTTAKPPRDRKL